MISFIIISNEFVKGLKYLLWKKYVLVLVFEIIIEYYNCVVLVEFFVKESFLFYDCPSIIYEFLNAHC